MAKLHKPESLQTSPMQSLQARATFLLLHLFVYQHRCHSETKLQPVDTKPLTQTQTLNMLEGLDSSLKTPAHSWRHRCDALPRRASGPEGPPTSIAGTPTSPGALKIGV